MAVKKIAKPFGFEATFYVVGHGRILAKIKKVKVDELWAHTILQPVDQNECLIPHLKDLIRIYLEPEDQDPSSPFKILYFNLNRPHFAS